MILSNTERTQQTIRHKTTSGFKRIALMGPWGVGNLGDASIQTAMIQHIRKYWPNAEIYGCSLFPEDTQKRHDIPSFTMCNWPSNKWWEGDGKEPLAQVLSRVARKIRAIPNPWLRKLLIPIRVPAEWLLELLALIRAFGKLQNFDALIVSGGGQLDDVFMGAWMQPYALLIWGQIAKLRKAKFFIVSVGAGPIDARLSKIFFRRALSLADYRSYRDANSKNYVERVLSFYRKDPIYPDLAHSLDLSQYQPKLEGIKKQRVTVGIAPIPHKYARTPPGLLGGATPTYITYLIKLSSFIGWLLENQYAILFFTGEDAVDRPVIQDIKKQLHEAGVVYSDEQIIENPISTVDELMFQLAETDLVVASRFHGVLLAHLLNKPTLALSFHDKIDSLMADSGQAEYCLSIDDFNLKTLKEKFIALEANQTEIKNQLEKRTQRYRNLLEEQYEYLFRSL